MSSPADRPDDRPADRIVRGAERALSRVVAQPEVQRLTALIGAALRPPPGTARIAGALAAGLFVHAIFAAAIFTMGYAMFFGLTVGVGTVPWPWAGLANLLLIAQFPLMHSLLLTKRGMRLLGHAVPGDAGRTLSTTTYAIVASAQLLLLFLLWTPSGIVWWQAEGLAFWLICAAYATSWLLLVKSILDAGIDVQSGALGWMSLLAKRKPRFPDLPTWGLFRIIRQPIYVAFALTLWTVPTWTPDQLALAIAFTAYCLLAPILKERRFAKIYGDRFQAYRAKVRYVVPRWPARRPRPAETTMEAEHG